MSSLLYTISGLPVHALVVHFAVVLLPLAAFGVLTAIYIPRFRRNFAFASVLGTFVGTGAAFVAKSAPDGYTLFATPPGPLVTAGSMGSALRFDPKAFTPTTIMGSLTNTLVVREGLPVSNLQELVAYCARVSNPGNQHNTETSEKLIKYMMEHAHWSPFEMVNIVMEIETTRDIARQILRHRSFSDNLSTNA